MPFAATLGALLLSLAPMDFYREGPYDTAVPRPEKILGYGPGDRHTTFREQEQVLQAFAAAAPARAKLENFGKSTEGRPLRLMFVSSPRNMARLSQIQADLATLANPPAGKDLSEVRKRTPAVVWINECIHGNETASFESGMWLTYNLIAGKSKRISELLDNTLVIVNPSYNPDGHERYVVYYNSIATGAGVPGAFESHEPSTVHGRTNHYRFDMNRDRISLSQAESRQEVQAFLKWNPHVYVDQHGQVETYFFPPNPMSVNGNVDRPRFNRWTEVFGRATGNAFDQNGFLYYIKDIFDLYYPGYLDSWTSLSGAIGMTHETDGGRTLNRERRDGTTLTLRDGIEKHFTSALAVAESAGKNRERLLADYEGFKRGAVTGKFAGNFQRVVLEGEPRKLVRLQTLLKRHGITSSFASQSFEVASSHDYWSDSTAKKSFRDGVLVVDMAQSQGPLAKTLLEPGSTFEPEFIKEQLAKKKSAPDGEKTPGPDGAEFYDWTGWAIPYAWDLKAWWLETAPPLVLSATPAMVKKAVAANSTVGYALRYKDEADILAVYAVMGRGVKVAVANKTLKFDGATFAPGTFLFLASRNDAKFRAILDEEISARGGDLVAIKSAYPDEDRNSPGGGAVRALRTPKIGIVFGNQTNMAAVGSLWYLMEQEFKLPFTALSSSFLSSGDLSSFTTIVVPAGATVSASGKFKEWVMAGGCVVALDNPGWAVGSSAFVELSEQKGEIQSLPGSLFRADLDLRSFLSYGYSEAGKGKVSIAFPVQGSSFYVARKEGGSVVSFSSDEKAKKLLSGWTWNEETEKALKGVTMVQQVETGRGHAVLFMQDPSERILWPGLNRMVLNAMLFGPG